MDIPEPVLAADEALYSLLQRVAFSRHLNPSNGREAREAFEAGAHAPPFTYVPLDDPDALRRALDDAEPPRDHPAGVLVGQCVDGIRRLVDALDHRTPEAFDAMNAAADWYPDANLLAERFVPARPTEPLTVRADQLIDYFESAFMTRSMHDWAIERDEVMSARVLVDSAKRVVRVNPKAHFRDSDLIRLVVHEIDVHARRATNGETQPLWCFVTGLPGSLATEEGLAMLAEEKSGTSSPGVLARQSQVVWAIDQARQARVGRPQPARGLREGQRLPRRPYAGEAVAGQWRRHHPPVRGKGRHHRPRLGVARPGVDPRTAGAGTVVDVSA